MAAGKIDDAELVAFLGKHGIVAGPNDRITFQLTPKPPPKTVTAYVPPLYLPAHMQDFYASGVVRAPHAPKPLRPGKKSFRARQRDGRNRRKTRP